MPKRSGRVSVQRGEHTFTAYYQVSRGEVTVTYWYEGGARRTMSARVGSGTVEKVAQTLLNEISDAVLERRPPETSNNDPSSRETKHDESAGSARHTGRLSVESVLHQLIVAERHIEEGRRRIAELRSRIEQAVYLGHDTQQSEHLLTQFEDSLGFQVAEHARLVAELRLLKAQR